MELGFPLDALILSWNSVGILVAYLGNLAIASFVLPAKVVPGMIMQYGTRLYYRCNDLSALFFVNWASWACHEDEFNVTYDGGLELLSASFIFSFVVASALHIGGRRYCGQASSLKPLVTGNLILDWYMGVTLWVLISTGMIGWIMVNLSNLAKSVQNGTFSLSMILYQLFCLLAIMVERLGFMLVGAYLVWSSVITTIVGWWLLHNKVELTAPAALVLSLIFMIGVLGYSGANNQKQTFKKNPKALIRGKPPKVIGGKLLASGYWGIARYYNYLGDFLLSLSLSLVCGTSFPIPYIYPSLLVLFFVSRERRDEAQCAEKYKEICAEYCKAVPWRIVAYLN